MHNLITLFDFVSFYFNRFYDVIGIMYTINNTMINAKIKTKYSEVAYNLWLNTVIPSLSGRKNKTLLHKS